MNKHKRRHHNHAVTMASDGRQAGVRVQSSSSKSHCCLKFAVTLLTIAVIVLVCIVLWLIYRTPATADGSEPGAQSAAARGLVEDEVCKLPKDVGPCRGAFMRYYYDYETKRCDEFMYGGCQGNANNFESIIECQERCMKPAEKAADVDVCKLPQDTGPCRALLPRFAYNDTIKACVPFIYGGCQGNGNNFETKEECEEKCMAPSDDPCKQPIKVGPCLALIPRYAFDSTAGECVEFMYGGCNPNDNNFETLEACQAKCPGKNVKAAATDVCELPQETGPCRARFIRYAYDGKAKACMPFTYGGCQGNENNFETKEECEEKCMNGGEDPCKLPIDVGPCLALVPRYAFDQKAKKCVSFDYGGCQGNKNNFETLEACQQTCPDIQEKGLPERCTLPISKGPCNMHWRRYAYSPQDNTCRLFIYGGCQGNENNFATREDCERECKQTL